MAITKAETCRNNN